MIIQVCKIQLQGISWQNVFFQPTKVKLFWQGHKNVRNRPYGFEIYLVNVKTIRTIVAFSEMLNFIVNR